MKKIFFGFTVSLLTCFFTASYADFMFEETDPYCSISGTTHTFFPGEISDTSSWSIPTAYESECDETPKLSQNEKERIYVIMKNYFSKKDFIGPVYGEIGYGGDDTLNPQGQDFINNSFFPAVKDIIINERKKQNPDLKKVAILNYAVKIIGYDYFIQFPN